MGNSLRFEFDFDEVFEGIKQGIIRELSEMEFDAARDVAISQVKTEVKKEIDLTWGDKSQLKEDIKSEIKDKVFGELIREVQGRYVTQFENYISEQLSKNPDRLKELRKEIVHAVSDDVYDAVYKSVRRDVQSKVDNWLNTMSGFGVKIQGSNHTISKEEYEELLERDRKLSALEAGGVDNWEWYGESLAQFYADDED